VREQRAKVAEHEVRLLENVSVRVAAELVVPAARLPFPLPIKLPGAAGVVVPVAVEFHGQALVGPAAIHSVGSGHAIRLRQRQPVVA
jgi:hypothetical protein